MKLFAKVLALFQPPAPEPAAPAPYANEEFLNVVMEQARRRIGAEQAAQAAVPLPPTDTTSLSAAA